MTDNPTHLNGAGQAGMSLAEWRRQHQSTSEVHDMVLPSGLRARLRRVRVQQLAFAGKIPMPLLAELTEMSGGKGKVELEVGDVLRNMDRWLELVNAIFVAAMVEPAVAEEPDEAHVALSEFDDMPEDKIAVMRWVMGDTEALKPFRPEHDLHGAAGQDSDAVQPASQHAAPYPG